MMTYPEGATGIDCGHIADRQIKIRKSLQCTVSQPLAHEDQERFRARFDLDGATDVSISLCCRSGIPEQQALRSGSSGSGSTRAD